MKVTLKIEKVRSRFESTEEENLKAVKKDGFAIKDIENPSEEVQLAAVKNNGYAIDHIDNPSEAVQLEAVKENGWAIENIDNPSDAVQLAAVEEDYRVIKEIKNPSKKVQAVIEAKNLQRVKENSSAIKDIENPSEAVQLVVVEEDGFNIIDIENPTEAVQLAAVKNSGNSIKYIDNPTEAVQLAAVKEDRLAINYISKPTKKVEDYLKESLVIPSKKEFTTDVLLGGEELFYILADPEQLSLPDFYFENLIAEASESLSPTFKIEIDERSGRNGMGAYINIKNKGPYSLSGSDFKKIKDKLGAPDHSDKFSQILNYMYESASDSLLEIIEDSSLTLHTAGNQSGYITIDDITEEVSLPDMDDPSISKFTDYLYNQYVKLLKEDSGVEIYDLKDLMGSIWDKSFESILSKFVVKNLKFSNDIIELFKDLDELDNYYKDANNMIKLLQANEVFESKRHFKKESRSRRQYKFKKLN